MKNREAKYITMDKLQVSDQQTAIQGQIQKYKNQVTRQDQNQNIEHRLKGLIIHLGHKEHYLAVRLWPKFVYKGCECE